MSLRLTTFAAIAANLVLLCGRVAVCDLPPGSADAVARLRRIQNISAELDTIITYTPLDTASPKSLRGSYRYGAKFRYLDGNAYYDWAMDDESLRRRPGVPRRVVTVITHERAERLTEHAAAPSGLGLITESARPPQGSLIDTALGFRCERDEDWLDPEQFAAFEWHQERDGTLTATRVVKKRAHKWSFDPKLGYAISSYRLCLGETVLYQIDCDDFRDTDGTWLPYKIVSRDLLTLNGSQTVTIRQEMTIHQYALNDPRNSRDSFAVTWSPKALVRDQRTGIQLHPPTTGPITDAQIVAVQERRQHRLDELAVARGRKSPARTWMYGGVLTIGALTALVWIGKRKLLRRISNP